MLALSIKQPWAQLIICGLKPIEIRTWLPPKKIIGQRVYIHASKNYDYKAPKNAHELFESVRSEVQEYMYGALLGTAVLADAYRYDYDCGRWIDEQSQHLNCIEWLEGNTTAFVFADPQPLKEPIPYRGQLGFFEVRI